MITAERLEELIKQGGKAWGYNDESVFDLPLKNTKDRIVAIPANSLIVDWYAGKDKGWFTAYYDPNKLCETKEQAEWHLKNDAERTERFEPPMWEDMQKILQQEPYYNFVFVKNNRIYEFVVSDKLGVRNYDCIDVDKYLFFGNSTKENYIKACEIVRDLFNKGGAKC